MHTRTHRIRYALLLPHRVLSRSTIRKETVFGSRREDAGKESSCKMLAPAIAAAAAGFMPAASSYFAAAAMAHREQ
jgi:hypothetical protein